MSNTEDWKAHPQNELFSVSKRAIKCVSEIEQQLLSIAASFVPSTKAQGQMKEKKKYAGRSKESPRIVKLSTVFNSHLEYDTVLSPVFMQQCIDTHFICQSP